MSNKVKFGLKNVHYATITVNEGVTTYGTPKAIPGAVSMTMDPKGEKTEFYADDVAYFLAESNQGYEGTLEIALITDDFKKDILQYINDSATTGGLYEDATKLPKPFALMFEFAGDALSTRHIFYNVNVSRPAVSSRTRGESIEVQTETMEMVASPGPNNIVKGSVKVGDTSYATFLDAVVSYTPPA